MASSDLVNMGISVVSYTLKDIHDDQVNLGSCFSPLSCSHLLNLPEDCDICNSPTGLFALLGEGSNSSSPKRCSDWGSGGQERRWDPGERSGGCLVTVGLLCTWWKRGWHGGWWSRVGRRYK